MQKYVMFSFMVLIFAVGIFSCATIIHGTTQDVGISSNPTGAAVTIDGKPYGTAPVTASLSRKDNHVVKIELEGFMPYETTVTRSVSGWIAGNILFGGLIGLAVDAISGGMYKLTPEQVQAELKEGSVSILEEEGRLFITVVLEPNPEWEKIGTLSRKN